MSPKPRARFTLLGMVILATVGYTLLSAQQKPSASGTMPVFQVDPAWPRLPNNGVVGVVSAVNVDSHDNVWILHRPRSVPEGMKDRAAPPVLEFNANGQFVTAWGGSGQGYDWPDTEHGIFVDSKDNVWITGSGAASTPAARSDDMAIKFTTQGKFIVQIGARTQNHGNADTKNLRQPADVFVYSKTNEAFFADGYGNRRVIVFDADTGAFKRMWGAFAKPPGGEDSCAIVSPKTFPDPEGPAHFNVAHAIRVAYDGMVYLADRENRRVQMFTNDGKFIKQLIRTRTPFARNLALSADSQQQFLYVGADKGITVVDRKTLDVVGAIQPAGILGPGHHIATDSKGNIYLAQTTAGMQKLVFKGMPPTQ